MRDYASDMATHLRNRMTGNRINSELVTDLIRDLDTTDPDLLTGWSRLTLHQNLLSLLRSLDARDRSQSVRRAFTDQRVAFEAGDLTAFDVVHVVNNEFLRKRVGEMTAADHRYVAQRYTASAIRASYEAEFHSVVAARLDAGQVTADAFNPSQYVRLRENIVSALTSQRHTA